MKKTIKLILKFLGRLNCKSKCCSGSECECYSDRPHPEVFERIDRTKPVVSSNLRRVTSI